MKKVLLILTLIAYSFSGFSQKTDNKFHFGIKAQPALAWLKVDAPTGTDLKSDGLPFGFGYGLILDFGFADRYAFSTGLEVAYRGGKTLYNSKDTSGATVVTKTDYSLQFIELPITLKLKTNEIGYMTYFFQVGFAPGIAIRSKADIETQKSSGTTTQKNKDVADDINELNLSLLIAGGAEYNISGNTSLLFGLAFNNGFLDVLDDKKYNGAKVKGNSNYLALTVGILF